MNQINRDNQLTYETVIVILQKRSKISFEIATAETEVARVTKQLLINKIDEMLCSDSQYII